MLPYKDALAAVIAVGDTPSPELIAASGDAQAVRPVVAYGVAAAILAGLLGVYLIRAHIGVAPEQRPEVLANSARTLAQQLGYTARPATAVYGFLTAGSLKTPEIHFWYRESDTRLQSTLLGNFLSAPGRVTLSDPPLAPGMLLIETDARGRLIRFAAIPQSPPAPNSQLDWKALFDYAGLDLSRFTEIPVVRLPPVAADSLLRWKARPSPNGPELTVAAASWMKQAVYYRVIDATQAAAPEDFPKIRTAAPAVVIVLIGAGLAALFFARKNLQQRRGDQKGAFRIGAVMFWICSGEWLLVARHSLSVREAVLASYALSWALAMGVLAYLCYLAMDPTVRRLYPDMLVSLQKVLTGARRDALLGRDILYGLGLAVLINLIGSAAALLSGEKICDSSGFTPRELAGLWLGDLRLGTWIGLIALASFIPLIGRRRKRRMRFGALGIVIAETGMFFLKDMPAVPDASAWYAQGPLWGYAALAVLTVYAARLVVQSGRTSGSVTQH